MNLIKHCKSKVFSLVFTCAGGNFGILHESGSMLQIHHFTLKLVLLHIDNSDIAADTLPNILIC